MQYWVLIKLNLFTSMTIVTAPDSVFNINKTQQNKLTKYSKEIKALIKSTLESVVRIGQILKDVRDNILPYGEWQVWVDTQFEGHISHDSADNWINLADLHEEYSAKYSNGIEKLTLSSLYKLSRTTVDPEVKETVLKLASEDEPLNRDEIDSVIRTYRKVKMAQAGLDNNITRELEDSVVMDDPKEIKALSRLSKKKQEAVTELFKAGAASSTKEAIKQLTTLDIPSEPLVKVDFQEIKITQFGGLEQVPSDSVNFCIVEAPLSADYVTTELNNLAIELDRILAPGGVVITTVGHKAIMYAGSALSPLKPLHVLCLRRQPGRSRSIVGSNIMSASVLLAMAYKHPYRAPKEMLVDLQTVGDNEAVDTLDEVVNGLEAGFDRFMQSLVLSGDTVMHVIKSPNNFNIKEQIKQSAINLKALELFQVG